MCLCLFGLFKVKIDQSIIGTVMHIPVVLLPQGSNDDARETTMQRKPAKTWNS